MSAKISAVLICVISYRYRYFALVYSGRALETICLWRAGADRRKPQMIFQSI